MKFCPVVPEICRGQVHGARKERRIRIRIRIIIRNGAKTMLNLCCIVASILKMATGRDFSMSGHLSTHISNFDDIGQCWFFAVLWWSFRKWRPVEIFRCRESIRDIIIYLPMICRWNRTILNLCGIVVSILKMATGRNFSMSGHHYLPTYQIVMASDNVEFWQYCGGH